MARILDANSDPIFDDVAETGTLAALGDSINLVLTGQSGVALSLQDIGAGVLEVTFECSVDGTNYFPLSGVDSLTGLVGTTATANGIWVFACAGMAAFRARVTAWTSGSALAHAKAGQGNQAQAFGGTITFAPGTALSIRNENDLNNTHTANLGIGASFTGAATDLGDFLGVLVTVYSDQASAVDGLEIQFSNDGATWRVGDVFSIGAGSFKTFTFQPVLQFFRVVYTNGGVGTLDFALNSLLCGATPKSSSHRLEDNVSGQDDATLQKAVIAAKLPGGDYQNIDASAGGALQVVITDENQDAFGRIRVSDPVTLIDSTFGYGLNPREFEDISSGNGVVTYDGVKKAALLSVTAGAVGVAGLQSYQYAHYNPGKSHLIFMTFCADPLGLQFDANQKFEVGYFDDDNGLFVRGVGPTDIYAVRRSSVSGVLVEESVERANWNIDVLDGTGSVDNPSGVLLNAETSQILVIDLQFLGVGRVRMGAEVAGGIIYAHEFNFANSQAGMYMQAGTLPIRWRFEDTGTAGWGRSDAYCAMVTTEGGAEKNRGVPLSTGNPPSTPITAASNVDTHLVSIRPKLTYNGYANRIWNILEGAEVLNTGATEVVCKVWYDPDITGGAWADVDTSDSGMEYNITATHAPGTGIEIGRFSVAATGQSKGAGGLDEVLSRLPITLDQLGANAVGAISLTAAGVGGTSAVLGTLSWREIR